jgi:anti-anti-sigma regulatory factor
MAMPETSPSSDDSDATLGVFRAELEGSLPFREDAALLRALIVDVPAALSALRSGYLASDQPCTGASRGLLSEGFSLFSLLCRRAGLLGATPTACLALARAALAALKSEGLVLTAACADDLAVVAVEGFSAGRDELRERALRTIARESQVLVTLAPRCFALFLAGSLLHEQLERLLDDWARQLFRADTRSVLLDISRLHEAGEDSARAIVAFASTLTGIGVALCLYEPTERFAAWFHKLDLSGRGARHSREPGEALARTLAAAGYELRTRGRLGELIDKVRAGAR